MNNCEDNEKYQQGKIYMMKCNKTGLCYIGSTIEKLNKRLGKHLTDYRGYMGINNVKRRNYRSSFDVIINENYDINLLENYPCNNRRELQHREALWIFKMGVTHRLSNVNMPSRLSVEDLNTIINLK
jgi:hypothetical protein